MARLASISLLLVAVCHQIMADGPAPAHANLPVLYKVDSPVSNVVVYRGAEVDAARQAGLIKGGSNSGNGNGNGYPAPAPAPAAPAYPPPPPPPTTPAYEPPTTTYAPPTTTTTYAPPPPPPTQRAYPTPAPQPSYPAPQPSYPAPQPSYPAPKPSYPAPQPSYPAPQPSYPAPAPKASYPAPAPRPAYPEPVYNDAEVKYNWEYEVKDDYSKNDFGHKESREGYVAQGKYYVALPDGRFQTVTYTADQNGYVPNVEYSGQATYEQPKPAYPSA